VTEKTLVVVTTVRGMLQEVRYLEGCVEVLIDDQAENTPGMCLAPVTDIMTEEECGDCENLTDDNCDALKVKIRYIPKMDRCPRRLPRQTLDQSP